MQRSLRIVWCALERSSEVRYADFDLVGRRNNIVDGAYGEHDLSRELDIENSNKLLTALWLEFGDVCYNGSGLDGLGGFSFIDGKYARRNKLLQLKCVCKVTWRLMIRVMPREVARFIQSRFGELKISEARYEDLLGEADQYYSSYLNSLSTIIKHT